VQNYKDMFLVVKIKNMNTFYRRSTKLSERIVKLFYTGSYTAKITKKYIQQYYNISNNLILNSFY